MKYTLKSKIAAILTYDLPPFHLGHQIHLLCPNVQNPVENFRRIGVVFDEADRRFLYRFVEEVGGDQDDPG